MTGRSRSRRARNAPLIASLVAATTLGPPASPAVAAEEAVEAGVRTLYLIRHGVYDEKDESDPDVGRALTPDGEEQARLTGRRLARLGVRFDVLHASTMTRARQTAGIIGRALGGMTPRLSRELRECTPPTVREDVMARQSAGGPDSCRETLARAWDRYMRPSPPRDSTELVVCYLVSRALGLDPTLWLNMAIANCSISVVQVRADGHTRLVSFDDVGHLPPAMQAHPAWGAPPRPEPPR